MGGNSTITGNNIITGNSTVNGNSTITGITNCSNDVKVNVNKSIDFGTGAIREDINNGRISYGGFDQYTGDGLTNYLHIIGAGTTWWNRRTRIWGDLDVEWNITANDILLQGYNVKTELDKIASFLNFDNLALSISMLSSSSNPTVTKGGTPENPTISFGMPASTSTSTSPGLSIGTVNTSTANSTFTASITGTNPNYLLNMNVPSFVTINNAQTVTGAKTFNNFKLNNNLQLTTPAVNITQTELSQLSGVSPKSPVELVFSNTVFVFKTKPLVTTSALLTLNPATVLTTFDVP